ncbi:hypothetical protein GJ744_005649 [Endocarpon pusillum]|uniref:Uncharacterized protein n=1 Tax=Endocarpon pusillum TaxID=364733 RepID=A0A8H7DYB2_9EURO|nr:hypothetical protein GJ744_005649 [Endocarpon pusillum]
MTQKYYTKRLLPIYIKAVQEARISCEQHAILQEDNDPSYGFQVISIINPTNIVITSPVSYLYFFHSLFDGRVGTTAEQETGFTTFPLYRDR